MATDSVQYTNATSVVTAGIANNPTDMGGKLRIARFDLEFSASSAGTTLNLCKLPAGAVFLGAMLAFEGTSSLTLDIGDSGDADRLVAAADLGTDSPTTGSVLKWFGRLESTAAAASPALGIGYKYTAETTITALTGGATATSGEVLRGFILYVID